ncbi:MAG: glycoside hydrolase family 68 protein [Alphaproteobacteria bacterium]|nr:glycoside hydrolase family 68 protein [Alphaproteobacteria bacterium]
MTLKLKNQWIWDFWFAKDGDDWHIFYLKADKSLGDADLRHRNVSIGHAKSQDLTNWTDLGTCFEPSKTEAFDNWTTWTGSVIKGEDGLWHLFYTGTNKQDGGMKQRIGQATSSDLHNWQRVQIDPILDIAGNDYEEYTPALWHDRAMRDPCVIKNPISDGYLMYFTAREPHIEEANAGGTIGFATSDNLFDWQLQPPIYRGNLFGQMEVPQVFEHQGYYYCLFCTAAEHFSQAYLREYPTDAVTGTHYLMANNPLGPWYVAKGKFLDGSFPAKQYSGKILKTKDGLKYLAFAHDDDEGNFIGSIIDPINVNVLDDGRLELEPKW